MVPEMRLKTILAQSKNYDDLLHELISLLEDVKWLPAGMNSASASWDRTAGTPVALAKVRLGPYVLYVSYGFYATENGLEMVDNTAITYGDYSVEIVDDDTEFEETFEAIKAKFGSDVQEKNFIDVLELALQEAMQSPYNAGAEAALESMRRAMAKELGMYNATADELAEEIIKQGLGKKQCP